jgi:hypothetical protein
MVHVRTVTGNFQARVIAARLGAEGIVTELRGQADAFNPFAAVSVWVSEADADTAAELLLADEVEAAFAPHPDDEEPSRSRQVVLWGLTRRQLLAGTCLVVVIFTEVAGRLIG